MRLHCYLVIAFSKPSVMSHNLLIGFQLAIYEAFYANIR